MFQANAELCYEKNRQDQLQLEKEIVESKSAISQIEYKLLGNKTKELLDEKKKWEEKYSDLEKQHQFKVTNVNVGQDTLSLCGLTEIYLL